jgi:hypothetical protein
MLVGLDFDNTIVCYDESVVMLSREIPDLPHDLPRTKVSLRDYLRAQGREEEWTAFQGVLYGPGMRHAEPYKYAIPVMRDIVEAGHQLVIVSHRSRRPYAGPPHDLHAAAVSWVADRLQRFGLFGDINASTSVYFLETRDAKVATIGKLGCSVFVDDLPEVLEAPGFPDSTAAVLFDPLGEFAKHPSRHMIRTWSQLPALLEELQ